MSRTLKGAIEERFYVDSGPGGQHRNRTETAVEVRLADWAADELGVPRGLLAKASTKSQAQNRKTARRILSARVAAELRKAQARDRFAAGEERVRSYHEPNDRVTDHGSGEKSSYRETVGKGRIGELVESRALHSAREALGGAA